MARNCVLLVLIFCTISAQAFNKYSKEANGDTPEIVQKPFRSLKVNLLWEKAQKRLPALKLKSLGGDLKYQDKEEMILKRLRSEGGDKEGRKELEVKRNMELILIKYGLDDHFKDEPEYNSVGRHPDDEDRLSKQVFKDKKLDKLWKKAEQSGFTDEQLKMLKEEFNHHSEKIDKYDDWVSFVDHKDALRERNNLENSLDEPHSPDTVPNQATGGVHSHQDLKRKHVELKRDYEALSDKVIGLPDWDGFDEPGVQRLWEMARTSDFNKVELGSMKEELQHYQHRVKKLKYLEDQLENEKLAGKHTMKDSDYVYEAEEKHPNVQLKHKIKELNFKVDKVGKYLQAKITQRHIEL